MATMDVSKETEAQHQEDLGMQLAVHQVNQINARQVDGRFADQARPCECDQVKNMSLEVMQALHPTLYISYLTKRLGSDVAKVIGEFAVHVAIIREVDERAFNRTWGFPHDHWDCPGKKIAVRRTHKREHDDEQGIWKIVGHRQACGNCGRCCACLLYTSPSPRDA